MIFKLNNTLFEGFTLKGLKTFLGREGHGFNATLYFEGKKVAFTYDDASGGEIRFDWGNKDVQKMLDDRLTKAGIYDNSDVFAGSKHQFEWSDQFFISDLVSHYLSIKEVKKSCKNKTVATVIKEDGTQGTFEWKREFSPAMELMLKSKYGDKLVSIWNKDFAEYL